MDPQSINGEPYGPVRFAEIVKEQYKISKNINTSFTDLDQVSPRERELLIQYIQEDNLANKKIIDDLKNKNPKTGSR